MGSARVNLFSDTQTLPGEEMRRAMASAEVGDEQRRLDPTVNALQERVAELLGQEAALFLPSGSMCNQIAIRLHTRPLGDEVYRTAPRTRWSPRPAAPATLAGAQLARPLEGEGGMFGAAALEAALRDPDDRHQPRSRLVCVEQTTNIGGGRIWPLDADRRRSRRRRARTACAPTSTAPACSTPWSPPGSQRGLSTPPASTPPGSTSARASARRSAPASRARARLIEEAWRYKQMFGGAMRQAGIVAAGALWALEHNVDRLAEDHANARALAEGLAAIDGVSIDPATVETNIVIFEVADPAGAGREPRRQRASS